MARIYLDWNATTPLRPEARAAMGAAMDALGNPSSVHAEGRRARAILERARSEVAEALDAGNGDIVFTSGATEAAAQGLAGRGCVGAGVEHDCVHAWIDATLPADADGAVTVARPSDTALQAANSETGVLQCLPAGLAFVDAAQAMGKVAFSFATAAADMAAVSAHKIGGPAGVGALVLRSGRDAAPRLRGGGQESGRRAGTENLIGIAGFGAAAAAAGRDLRDGVWERVGKVRDTLEQALEAAASDIIFFGRASPRLPNTSCFAIPGWRSETQVMQMDLAGFAISAGSACSSGKVRKSRVLGAMGFADAQAESAVRVSIGPETRVAEVLAFADAWEKHFRRFRQKAA